mmetsp:Transcript_37040/g.110929  ORF Transcript_37040/g.110929 Transcript_37040/m.110929 type:complete len:216 (+) Transcript_37040:2197-2844(+)
MELVSRDDGGGGGEPISCNFSHAADRKAASIELALTAAAKSKVFPAAVALPLADPLPAPEVQSVNASRRHHAPALWISDSSLSICFLEASNESVPWECSWGTSSTNAMLRSCTASDPSSPRISLLVSSSSSRSSPRVFTAILCNSLNRGPDTLLYCVPASSIIFFTATLSARVPPRAAPASLAPSLTRHNTLQAIMYRFRPGTLLSPHSGSSPPT